MSRQMSIPLLEWRQGAGKRLIRQTRWAMHSMVSDSIRLASLNPLLWINLLAAGSIAMFWTLGASEIKAAQTNPVAQPSGRLEQPQAISAPEEKSGNREGEAATNLLPSEESQALPLTAAQPIPTNSTASVQTIESAIASEAGKQLAHPTVDLGHESTSIASSSSEMATATSPVNSAGDATSTSEGQATAAIPLNITIASEVVMGQLPYSLQTLPPLPVPSTPPPGGRDRTQIGQLPSLPQPPNPIPIPTTTLPMGSGSYNTFGQPPYLPQAPGVVPVAQYPYPAPAAQYPYPQPTIIVVPVPTMGQPMAPNLYNPAAGQYPYPQPTIIVVPVPMMGQPMAPTAYPYGSMVGQYPYVQQAAPPLPFPGPSNAVGFNGYGYNPAVGQAPYFAQPAPSLPVPLPTNAIGSGYSPVPGQAPYFAQPVPSLPAPLPPNAIGSGYSPVPGQAPYFAQPVPSLPAPLPSNSVGFNGYNPNGQQLFYAPQPDPSQLGSPTIIPVRSGNTPDLQQFPGVPQGVPALPVPLPSGPSGLSSYNPNLQQSPNPSQSVAPLPTPLPSNPVLGQFPNVTPPPPALPGTPANPNPILPVTTSPAVPPAQPSALTSAQALTTPALRAQGTYITQGEEATARARVTGIYPLNSRTLLGGTLDFVSEEGNFVDSAGQGLNVNELYLATAPFADIPNLRFVVGQLDLTSYFDRNSFAKDAATHFFNPVFQTNPALAATGIGSRPGALVNWTITDSIEAKAAIFSSARNLGDFTLDGFAGEIGLRYGNAIIRGTFASGRDAGSRDGFREIFLIDRGDDRTGIRSSDREESYGVNAEVFVPNLNMGIFGRYGRYDNRTIGRGGDTFSFGVSFLDVFTRDDRLGLAYGRDLSNGRLRQQSDDQYPDVLELFYDFRFLPNLRLGFTLQERNGFADTYAGFRVKTEFDITPEGR